MKIVILAAGEGKRMRPLTLDTPKPLLKFAGQTALDHLFDALPNEIDEAIISVKYLAENIKKYCGNQFHGRKVSYVEGDLGGNASGFLATESFFDEGERFAIAYGDEVILPEEVKECLKHQYSWLCYRVSDPTIVGIAIIDKSGYIRDIIEKPQKPISNLAANGFMVANKDIFKYSLKLHSNGEYYFSHLMGEFAKNHSVYAVNGSDKHSQLTSPEDIKRLDAVFRKNI